MDEKNGKTVLANSKPIPRDELRMLNALISEAKWRDTTTYPAHMQHAYILKKDYPALMEALVNAIREYGFDMQFYGTTYRYLIIGEFKYWAFQTLVNRENLKLSDNEERYA